MAVQFRNVLGEMRSQLEIFCLIFSSFIQSLQWILQLMEI